MSQIRHPRPAAGPAVEPLLTWGRPTVNPERLTALAAAVTNREQLRFAYRRRDGAAGERLVEPYKLVSAGRRWYLVGYEAARTDAGLPGGGDPARTGPADDRPARWRLGRPGADRRQLLPVARSRRHPGLAGVAPADPRLRHRGARAAGADRVPPGDRRPGSCTRVSRTRVSCCWSAADTSGTSSSRRSSPAP
ncbi:WYL domain-containing protein [Micromonospora sp. U21]|nr:WYL domain-containing protein [Micromonospora sp. U21]